MSDSPAPPIAATAGYVLAQVCRAHRQAIQEALTPFNLHVGQEMILLRLWQQDNLTQTELAGNLCIQPATVTRMLARMERTGLIVRHPDPADQRVSRVCVTPAGRAVEQAVHAAWQQVEEQMLTGFTLEERVLLRRLLVDLQENLANLR